MSAIGGPPELALDLFDDAAIRDPYPLYRAIRAAGPAVWLPAHEVFALGRFADVRDALRADETLVSGRGVGLSDFVNSRVSHTVLGSDGEAHRRRRAVLIKPMMPSALAEVRPRLDSLADALVADLVTRGSFDGIADFAQHLPVAVVSHLIGLPEAGRERMLDWAKATFDALGPLNARAQASAAPFLEMTKYIGEVKREALAPDGWAARLFVAGDEGRLSPQEVRGLFTAYIAPSLDTTILATGNMLHALGMHPDQYELVRANPELIPAAVSESLRFGSPVRGFTRLAISTYPGNGFSVPEGARVLVLYGSANRDERHYSDPDRFDVTRDARDHLAFGTGVHRCAGSHLAQLEMEALLRALVARVKRIEVGAPEPLLCNLLHSFASFRASFAS